MSTPTVPTDKQAATDVELLIAIGELARDHELGVDGVRLHSYSTTIDVASAGHVQAWARALGVEMTVRDLMPCSIHYKAETTIAGRRVEVMAVVLSDLYKQVADAEPNDREDRVRAAAAGIVDAEVVEDVPALTAEAEHVPDEVCCEYVPGPGGLVMAHASGCPYLNDFYGRAEQAASVTA